jgi:SAM-dependent methyltransferase
MKFAPFPQFSEVSEEYFDIAQELAKAQRESFIRKYGKDTTIDYLAKILQASGRTDVKGLRVLDLGCGSKQSADYKFRATAEPRLYEPWLCRLLHHLGAHAIGIDRDIQDEEFEHHKIDLLETCISDVVKEPVDIISAFALFDSPTLNHGVLNAGRQLFGLLNIQFDSILKEDGAFVFNPEGTGYSGEFKEIPKAQAPFIIS